MAPLGWREIPPLPNKPAGVELATIAPTSWALYYWATRPLSSNILNITIFHKIRGSLGKIIIHIGNVTHMNLTYPH